MNFIIIFGPPAAGKMTVGQELSKLTGYKLFHNHVAIEPALAYFPFGTPSFREVVETIRKTILREAFRSKFEGFIFTYAWATTDPEDNKYVSDLRDYILSEGGRCFFAELDSELATRLERNKTANRLLHKPSKRDLDYSEKNLLEMDAQYVMQMTGDFPFPDPYIRIKNDTVTAEDAAKEIQKAFKLKK